MRSGILYAGCLTLFMIGPAMAQNCGVTSSKMSNTTAVFQQAQIALQSGQRARACRLLKRMKDQVESDIDDYQACGHQGLVVTAEGLLDSIVSQMSSARCD